MTVSDRVERHFPRHCADSQQADECRSRRSMNRSWCHKDEPSSLAGRSGWRSFQRAGGEYRSAQFVSSASEPSTSVDGESASVQSLAIALKNAPPPRGTAESSSYCRLRRTNTRPPRIRAPPRIWLTVIASPRHAQALAMAMIGTRF